MTLEECLKQSKSRVSYVCYRSNELIRYGKERSLAFKKANIEADMIQKCINKLRN